MRVSVDGKATVKIGPYSRGGCTRGDPHAADHDMGCEEKYTPVGVVNEDNPPVSGYMSPPSGVFCVNIGGITLRLRAAAVGPGQREGARRATGR